MTSRTTSILLTVLALSAGASLLGAGALTVMLTATDPAMTAKDAISNYVGGVALILIATGILIAAATKGKL